MLLKLRRNPNFCAALCGWKNTDIGSINNRGIADMNGLRGIPDALQALGWRTDENHRGRCSKILMSADQ